MSTADIYQLLKEKIACEKDKEYRLLKLFYRDTLRESILYWTNIH